MAIYLVGYMASGKSTIGRLLAHKLGWTFVDLDDAFEALYGLKTGEAIGAYGMERFRKMERDAVERVADMAVTEHIVYATGGGFPTWEDNMEALRELGTTFYIRWSPEDLVERLYLSGFENRPLLDPYREDKGKLLNFVRTHLAQREPYYRQAHHTIDAPLTALDVQNDEELAQELFEFAKNYKIN